MECNDEVYTLEIFYTKSKLKYECVETFWSLNRLNFIFQDRVTVINHILFLNFHLQGSSVLEEFPYRYLVLVHVYSNNSPRFTVGILLLKIPNKLYTSTFNSRD